MPLATGKLLKRLLCLIGLVGSLSVILIVNTTRVELNSAWQRSRVDGGGVKRPKDTISVSGATPQKAQIRYKPGEGMKPEKNVPSRFSSEWWKNHAQRVCQELGMSSNPSRLNTSSFQHVLVDDRHRLLYCPIPKVASSNIGKIFAILAGLTNVTDPNQVSGRDVHYKYSSLHTGLDAFSMSDVIHRLNHYFKFIFIRDPLERLLSAFRNKLDPPNNSFKYLSHRIIKKYRVHSTFKGNVTFLEFLRYIGDPKSKIPTNGHWVPFYQFCRPCDVNYDFVGKLSSLDEDIHHIVKINNLTGLVKLPENAKSTHHSLHRTDLLLKDYYSKVPRKLLRRVYHVYYPDYAILNMSLPHVLKTMLS